MKKNRLIIKNTLFLYSRQVVILIANLYTMRVVLEKLGIVDFGIYNVSAGIVTFFSFISGSLAAASQRFFSFEIGSKQNRLKEIFSLNVYIYITLSFVFFIIFQLFGPIFVRHVLSIPSNRIASAIKIVNFISFSFMISLISTPYFAIIIAKENMNVYLYVSFFEVSLKLATVYLLNVIEIDKLVLYGFLNSIATIFLSTLYILYSSIIYKDIRIIWYWDYNTFRTLIEFTAWNLFGSIAFVCKTQAINILLNISFGPIINTARGIASQISTAVLSFSQNISTAVKPQIIKSYAAQEYQISFNLVYLSSKLIGYLMLFLLLPLQLETPTILSLWLGQTPKYAIIFTRLILFDAMIESLSYPLMTVFQASGKIRMYQLVVGGVLLLNFPISLIVLKFGAGPEIVMTVGIILSIIALFLRLLMAKSNLNLLPQIFVNKVIRPFVFVLFTSSVIPCGIIIFINESGFRLIFTSIASSLCLLISVFLFGLEKAERQFVINYLRNGIRDNVNFQ